MSLQLIGFSSLREKVLKLAHDSLMAGHLGIRKTLNRVVAELFRRDVCGDEAMFCRSCDICQRSVWEYIYILNMIDNATWYPEAVALLSIGTERFAEALVGRNI